MRRLVLAAAAIGLVAAGYLVVHDAAAAAPPTVNSIVEGREGGTGKEVLVLVGDKLTAVNGFNLADTGGTLAGVLTLKLRTKNILVFGLPDGLAAGAYKLRLFYGKGSSGEIPLDITVSNLLAPPGSVQPISLDAALRSDLDDALTLDGKPPSFYTDAANLTGSLSADRFSAYADLAAEAKVGTASDQVAAGSHTHNSLYVLRAGDTVAGANFTVSATSGSPLTTSTTDGSAAGVSATNSGSGGSGLHGRAESETGVGVLGDNTATSGDAVGVLGSTLSTAGIGVLGNAPDSDVSGATTGVEGRSAAGGGVGVRGRASGANGVGVKGETTGSTSSSVGVYGSASASSGVGVLAVSQGVGARVLGQATGIDVTAMGASAVGLSVQAEGGSSVALQVVGGGGNLAIFKAWNSGNPQNKARIDSAGKGYFNGGTQASGADFAESVVTERPAKEYAPGDVIVIDPKAKRRFALSSAPNSKLVAGVYATRPGMLVRDGDVDDPSKFADTEIPMAIVGIVPCKVCDENGPVAVGDLLVTSSLPGHAMKAPADPAPGSILGKALGALEGPRGKVEVLLIGR